MKILSSKSILIIVFYNLTFLIHAQPGYLDYYINALPSNIAVDPNEEIILSSSYTGIPNHSCGATWSSYGEILFKLKLVETSTLSEINLPDEWLSFEGQNCNSVASWNLGNIMITLPCNVPSGNYYLMLQTFNIGTGSIPGVSASLVTVHGYDNITSSNFSCQDSQVPCSFNALTVLNITNNGVFTDININDLSQGCSASAEAIPLDGVGPYTYSWTSGITTSVANFSSPGNQQVTVSDAYGCDVTESIALLWNNTISDLSIASSATACSIDNGSATANVTGGFLPLSYLWSNGDNTQTISNLGLGTYSIIATDNTGCEITDNVAIDYPYLITSTLTTQQPCTYDEGAIFSTVSGVAPYVYNWNEGENTADLIGIIAGTYSVTIVDANGCQTSNTVTLNTITSASYYDYPNGLTITSPSQSLVDLAPADGIIRFCGPLIIKSGVNYNINNKILEFARDLLPEIPDQGGTHSGVIIQQKAKLTATNCTFKGVSSCDAMWQGIQVWGDDYIPNKEKPFIPILKHGELVLTNSTIRDAHIGVALYRINVPFTPNALDHGRGILKAKSSTFLNNRVSVDFRGRSLVTNNSYIKECNFTCNESLIDATKYFGEGSDVFIRLSKVKNPLINGNTFNGNIAFAIDQRATGIRSYDAGYVVQSGNAGAVSPSSPPVPNVFTNLSQGIDVYATGGAVSTIRIKDNRFNNVYQGITASGSNFDEISFNLFNTPMGEMTFNSWAMFLNTSSGFLAAENILNTLGTNQFTFGIVNKNVNLINGEVYKNRFIGDYNTATQAEGTSNNKLQIDCNQYLGNNYFDWTVLSGTLANQGQCIAANPLLQATNIFGNCTTSDESQIFSTASFLYSTEPSFAPNCKSTTVTNDLCIELVGSYANACPQLVSSPCPSCVIALQQDFNNTPPGLQRDKIKGELIRTLAQEGDVQQLINLLTSEGLPDDKKIIIPTHIQRKEFSEARILLNSLDQSDSENQKYFELFDIITTIGETERELDEITVSEKQTIENVANSGTQVSIQAEALLAELSSSHYIRFPELISTNSAMMISTNQDDIEEFEQKVNFTVYPNPSESDVVVQFEEGKEAIGFLVDGMGRVIRTLDFDGQVLRYEINDLAHGIYTLSIKYIDGILEAQRIIIQ